MYRAEAENIIVVKDLVKKFGSFIANDHLSFEVKKGEIFGFLGALVYYGHRTGSHLVRGTALRYAIMMGIFGLIMPGVDNFAHAGGFAGGYLMAQILDPLKPERIDHIVMVAEPEITLEFWLLTKPVIRSVSAGREAP